MYYVKGDKYSYATSSLLKAVFNKVTKDREDLVIYKGENKVGTDVLLSAVDVIFTTLDAALDKFVECFDLLTTLEDTDRDGVVEFITAFTGIRSKLVDYKENLLLESIGFYNEE